MDVQGPGGISGPNRIAPQRVSSGLAEKTDLSQSITDRAEISEAAQLLNKLAEVPEIRMEKIEGLKELITTGRYETKEKVERAVEKLMEEL